ncbi:MAG: metallophosphoesterase, partial [Planctomycetaceae bacterium]
MPGRTSNSEWFRAQCGPADDRGALPNFHPRGRWRPFCCLLGLLGWGLAGGVDVWGWPGASARAAEPPVTFFATSDSHYEAVEKVERHDRNAVTLRRMNELPGQRWPDALGGDPIDKPRGVLVLGDLIDDGDRQGQTEIEWNHFENQFGLDGTDGLLQFPVFEGWGNHDGPPADAIKHGFSVQQQIRRRNLRRLDQQLVAHLAPNQLHYSWDWNGVHFVQANLYPADRQHPQVRYSLPWHDPQLALQFVREDLAAHVGDSGRPVIIMAHCGFDTDWWVADDWNAFHAAIAPYNVVAYFHGHSGTGIRKWQPAEGGRPLQIVNTGQTEKGFFVAQVSAQRLRVAFQVKRTASELENVAWEWKYLLDLPLAGPGARPPAEASPAGTSPIGSQPASTKPTSPPPARPQPAPAPKPAPAPQPAPAPKPAPQPAPAATRGA